MEIFSLQKEWKACIYQIEIPMFAYLSSTPTRLVVVIISRRNNSILGLGCCTDCPQTCAVKGYSSRANLHSVFHNEFDTRDTADAL